MKNKVKVVTYNLKCQSQEGFSIRISCIQAKIREQSPDIIGFQEVLPHQKAILTAALPEYQFIGCGRGSDYLDEFNPIAYKRDQFDLFELSVFWLSPTPFVPGSRYEEQSSCPRICNTATFRSVNGGTPFRIYNTHLDHIGEEARVLGMQQILRQIETDNARFPYPLVMMGDFNALPNSTTLQSIRAFQPYPLQDTTENLEVTFHNYGDEKAFCKIDYIITTKDIDADIAYTWTEYQDYSGGQFLSDHYPVCVTLSI